MDNKSRRIIRSEIVRSLDGGVPAELPLATLVVVGAEGAVSVAVVGVFPAVGSEKLSRLLRGILAGDAVHLDLNPNGASLDGLNLPHRLFRHGGVPLRICWCEYNSFRRGTGVYLR